MAPGNYFPPPPQVFVRRAKRDGFVRRGGFAARSKIVARLPSSAALRPCGSETVSASGNDRQKAASGAADPPARKAPAMTRNDSTFLSFSDDAGPEFHTGSPTAHLLDELALCGHPPHQDEPGSRPLPEPDAAYGQLNAAVEALSVMLTGTRLEDDLADLLWSFVNLFHRKTDRIE